MVIQNLNYAVSCYQINLPAPDPSKDIKVELVSKELNHFGAIASFFRDWALGTLTGGA